ncbi:MAG TPA: phage portal protein [Firmicutes bacterium]|nr:phage portal protein [Bacillota bacterium]
MTDQKRVLTKAITIQADQRTSAGGSKQLPADPFSRLYSEYGLVRPPYRLEQLLELKESNPIHCACIEQKSSDIAGLGWHWVPRQGIDKPNEKQRDALEEFLAGCNPEMTFREILQAVWDDVETLGWGIVEVVRNAKGLPAELYHVPGHTVRAHRDGVRLCQIRENKMRWFKRFGAEGEYDLETGEPRNGLPEERQAGELIVIRKPGSRSSYYGIPTYISALGAIVGSLAARDFNITWFREKTVPDMALIIEGADVSEKLANELRTFFNIEARGQHHKLLILPIPSDAGAEVRARFEKLTSELKDASFRLYRHDNAVEILVAHRVPPYRIGWAIVGSLGGSTAKEMTEIYKRSVIQPGQEILEHRLNNQLFKAFEPGLGELQWRWKLDEIDLSDQMQDLEYSIKGVQYGIFTPNEARQHLGKQPYPGGDVYYMPQALIPAGQAEVSKADEDPRDKEWDDWVRVHHRYEKDLRDKVVDFFAPRRSAC